MKTLHSIFSIAVILYAGSIRAVTTYTTTTNGVTWTYTLSSGGVVLGGDDSNSPTVSKNTSGVIVVPELIDGYPVVGVGRYAFYACSKLSTIVLPPTLSSIGHESFYQCEALQNIVIPDSVKTIDSYSFYDCTSLTNVVLGNGIVSIPDHAFYRCTSLRQINIPNGVTAIGNDAFSYCKGLQSVTIPDNVTSLGSYVFNDCTILTNIVIGKGIKRIPNYAFSDCTSLRWMGIPDNVTAIGDSAFYGCTGLRSFSVPDSITSLGKSAFRDCSGLTNVVLGCGITAVADSAFYGCASLRRMVIPDNVTAIGDSAFYGCTGLQRIFIGTGATIIGDSAFYGCTGLQDVTIPKNVTSIGSKAFYNCKGLREASMPSPPANIGNGAFCGCIGLVDDNGFLIVANRLFVYQGDNSTAIIPDGVIAIDDFAFSGCESLQSVTIPSTVTTIGAYAFAGCSGLTTMDIPNSVRNIGAGAFSGCIGLVDAHGFLIVRDILFTYAGDAEIVVVPDGVTRLDDYAFSGCDGIKSISLPSSLKAIGTCSFQGCVEIENLVLPESVTTIGNSAFRNCRGLKALSLPANVTNLGASLFDGCSQLRSLTIPQIMCDRYSYSYNYQTFNNSLIDEIIIADGVTTIGEYAFENCYNIRKLVIPNSVTQIGRYDYYYNYNDSYYMRTAFYGLRNLTSITIPQSICGSQRIYEVFDYPYYLREVNIADGATSIGPYLFQSCQQLESVTIASTVTNIENNAFASCTSLKSIYIEGDAPNVKVGAFNSVGSSCVVYVNRGSYGWNTDIPGNWQGLPIRYVDCTVMFDPAGGTVAVNSLVRNHGATIGELPTPVRNGYLFVGWFTQPENGVHVTSSTVIYDDVTYYARWEKIIIAAPVISPADGSLIAGRGRVVTITCEADGADIYYSVNGTTPRPTEEFKYNGSFTITETTTIKAVAVKDGIKSDYVLATLTKTDMTLAEAAGATDLAFTTCANAPWTPCVDETSPIGSAAISGIIGDNTNTWIETSVSGSGTLSFFWRVECEEDEYGDATWDRLVVYTNGIEIARIDGITQWQEYNLVFSDGGTHTIRWEFLKDGFDEYETADMAWISGITWLPGICGTVVDANDKGVITTITEGYLITANDGQLIASDDVRIYAVLNGQRVETTSGYNIVIAEDGKSAKVMLRAPMMGIADGMVDAEKDKSDPTGFLVTIDETKIAAKPKLNDGEVLGALPVKAHEGLYYQAAWGNDLANLTRGEKIQATGDTLYLGVVKQTGDKGFYRVTVSEQ